MILLDTDVLSEAMRDSPDARFAAWFDDQPRMLVWTTAISLLEIRFGIERLPVGRRRNALALALERTIALDIEGKVLAFDQSAAEETAILMAERQRAGRPGDLRDSMIAGIAIAHRATLATRNTRHFADLAVPVIDPWQA
jgi:predicted nucleic acid-binding protein